MVATSATRDAANRSEFVEMVTSVLGVGPEVISGQEEAALSFVGAVFGLPDLTGRCWSPTSAAARPSWFAGPVPIGVRAGARSMDVGCVRMTERHLRDDPPTAGADRRHRGGDVRAALTRRGGCAAGDPANHSSGWRGR